MKRASLIALLLVYFAMVAAAVVSRQTLERLPHLEDEFTYLFQARIFQHGDVYIETPQPERAFWQPFLVTIGDKRFGKYPPGYPLLLAIGTGMQVPWVVNLWLGGLTVALVYRLARELYDETAGVIAALLLAASPIAVLLNATLMSHTAAMFFGVLFIYALWRLERGKNLVRWGIMAGIGLGMLIATRPLAAVGLAFPFILYTGLRVLWVLWQNRPAFLPTLKPLIAVAVFTMLLGSLYFAFNYIVTGDPTANLYTYIWDYDKVGFGEGHGRYQGEEYYSNTGNGVKVEMQTYAGHSLKRGKDILKRNSKCYFRDLFGWVPQPDNPPTIVTASNGCLVDKRGYSWVLVPFAFLFLYRSKWSMLLVASAATIILINLAYWIGAEVYSARYYFEATALFAILTGGGISGIARLADKVHLRYGVYALLGIVVGMTIFGYIPRRINPIKGYGFVSQAPIEQVREMRYTPDTPVLVISMGDQHWRRLAPFMAITDPYATNDIIGVRDPEQEYTEELMERYKDRQVIFVIDGDLVPVDIPGQGGYQGASNGQ